TDPQSLYGPIAKQATGFYTLRLLLARKQNLSGLHIKKLRHTIDNPTEIMDGCLVRGLCPVKEQDLRFDPRDGGKPLEI
ncbi:MAG: hypothetical protein KAT27_05445, partial [Desulfobacterales bacterium]|nr:hypothetical protein [Desulfobacterales bacterium]